VNRIVERLAQFLSMPPDPALGAGRVGARQPATSGDLPALVISLQIDDVKGIGLGRFVREGHTPTRSTSLIEVAAAEEDKFLPGLKTLRISPLPIIRNPDATTPSFSQQDISIRNLTDPNNPRMYQMVDSPSRADEFGVFPSRGEVAFGQPQIQGDRLELMHWTLTWRDDIRADRFSGVVTLEAWSSTFNDLEGVVQRTLAKLRALPDPLRRKGFLRMLSAGLAPATQMRWEPAVGTTMVVYRQAMEFRFTAEIEAGGEISAGGRIRRIDVAMDETVDERFSVPSSAGLEP
jgi:hypothetical protein